MNKSQAGIAQKFDKFCVKFVIRIPGTSSEFHGWIEVGKHVDFAGWVLGETVSQPEGHEVTVNP